VVAIRAVFLTSSPIFFAVEGPRNLTLEFVIYFCVSSPLLLAAIEKVRVRKPKFRRESQTFAPLPLKAISLLGPLELHQPLASGLPGRGKSASAKTHNSEGSLFPRLETL